MGVDCKLTLPAKVRIDDVATVLAILTGVEPVKKQLTPKPSDGWYTKVEGIRYNCHNDMPGLATIEWRDGTGKIRHKLYHFEFEQGYRGIMCRSYAEWICIARHMVVFFGGSVDYQDCDEIDADYTLSTPSYISAEDGKPWQDFQEAMFNCKPITPEEIEACEQYAAYKKDD